MPKTCCYQLYLVNYIRWISGNRRAWLAQSVEHETLNLRVVGSSPTLGDHFLDVPFLGSSPEVKLCLLKFFNFKYTNTK